LPHKFNGIDREEVKAVINSAIGSGTSKQTQPTEMMTVAEITQARLTEIRKQIIPAYDCLKLLYSPDGSLVASHDNMIRGYS
jgi:hypothetical protein